MINNTSVQKWDRLAQKQLDQQFMNEIVHGLQCSPFEAKAILDTVYRVYAPYFETSGTLKPGQILFQVISIDEGPSTHLADSKQITVTLTLDAGEEDLRLREISDAACPPLLSRRRGGRGCWIKNKTQQKLSYYLYVYPLAQTWL